MKPASQIFTDESRKRINAAVVAAESKTAAEIVPVVATESGRYDRAEDLIGFAFAIIALVIAWLLFQGIESGAETWTGPKLGLNLLSIVLILVGAFIVGALLASRVDWLRRLATTRAEMQMEVNERARQVFFDQRIHHARSGAGMLIYVSLFERVAAIIADETVIDKLGMPVIEELCNTLIAKLRSGDIGVAMEQTIAIAGEKLSQVMPRQAGDVNELADALVTVD
jgi:putative membrane protein